MMTTEFDINVSTLMVQLVPELLRERPYGIYELAQEFSQKLKQPICSLIAPLSETLNDMSKNGKLSYDRDTHHMILT
ncbi:MAG: hypothetical protein QNJ47_16745 [Nostocaceae cyanobacterium]|nr:hypothetical protein [Nostocaceae cyanobacterium]